MYRNNRNIGGLLVIAFGGLLGAGTLFFEASFTALLSFSCSLLVSLYLGYIYYKKAHWFLRPSLLILAAWHVRLQWPSVFMTEKISTYLPYPQEFFLMTHLFPLLFIVGSYPLFRAGDATAMRIWRTLKEPIKKHCVWTRDLAWLSLVASLAIVTYYLIIVPIRQTGLYVLFVDPLNLRYAREDGLKLLTDPVLRYLYTWQINTFGPLLLTAATIRLMDKSPFVKKIFVVLLIIFASFSMVLVGQRSAFASIPFCMLITYYLVKFQKINIRHVVVLICVISLLPAFVTLRREGADFSFASFSEYFRRIALQRLFIGTVETALSHVHYAQTFGFVGVAGIRPLAVLFGKEYFDLPTVIGALYEYQGAPSSTMANTNFLYAYYTYFGLFSIVLCVSGVLLFDLFFAFLSRHVSYCLPFTVLFFLKATSVSEGVFTSSFITGGYMLIPLIVLFLEWTPTAGHRFRRPKAMAPNERVNARVAEAKVVLGRRRFQLLMVLGAICLSGWWGPFPNFLSAAFAGSTNPARAAGVGVVDDRGCDYYASPSGTGDGLSLNSPFQIQNFWAVASPGKTLCLTDGVYSGEGASMIHPPSGLQGRAGALITIKALHDGSVLFDGQQRQIPVQLSKNDWFVLEGFNACCSSDSVYQLRYSGHNTLRRVTGWDAADGNTNIFDINSNSEHNTGPYNLLEDVAGWGVARKVFSAAGAGDFTTIRRAWGRWEGSHVVGPKMTFTLAYDNYNTLVENAIGAWSSERLKETYVLHDFTGQPWTGSGGGTQANYDVNQPYGIFAMDGFKPGFDKNAHIRLLGSLAYIRAGDRFQPSQVVFFTKADSISLENVAVYIEPRTHLGTKTFNLRSLDEGSAVNLSGKNLTGIGGANADIHADWRTGNVLQGRTTQEIFSPPENIFTSTRGAKLCFRYQDGELTNEPLWPWPMNQRILDATRQSGRTPVDVTATVEELFGRIPDACRNDKAAVDKAKSSPDKAKSSPDKAKSSPRKR